eukprot:COSAG01_NODE_3183_length_6447_cov_3.930687_6_plen_54_part_00
MAQRPSGGECNGRFSQGFSCELIGRDAPVHQAGPGTKTHIMIRTEYTVPVTVG